MDHHFEVKSQQVELRITPNNMYLPGHNFQGIARHVGSEFGYQHKEVTLSSIKREGTALRLQQITRGQG